MTKTEYRADIDGLRAIAVILVLAFHAFPNLVPGGFIGVDVFFVISGFLITRIISFGDFSFRGFYARRARRLFPALALVTAFSVIAGWLYLTPAQFESLGKQVLASSLFVPNLLFWSEAGYFDAAAQTKPLLHLWSLGVEEQFYFVWPALLLVSARLRLNIIWVLAGVTLLALVHCLHLHYVGASSAAFYSPLSRAWELSAGGLLAFATVKPNTSRWSTLGVVVGLGMLVLHARYIGGGSHWPNITTITVVIGSMLVIYFGRASNFAQRALGSTLMVFLGRISYPLYLWHWPILTFLYLRNGAAISNQQAAAALFVSFCLAALTYLAVEEPLKKRLSLRFLATLATSVLALVGATGFTIVLLKGIPSRLPTSLQEALAYEQYDFKADAYNPGCWLDNTEPTSKLLPVCIQRSEVDSIAIWGDSHAARLSPGLRKVFGADRVSQLTRNGCAPVLGLGAPASLGCRDGNADVLALIEKLRPKTLILFGAWQNYPTLWESTSEHGRMLIDTIRKVKAAGISKILIIGPAPRFDPSLPSMLLRDWSLVRWTTVPVRLKTDLRATDAIDKNLEQLAKETHVGFFSLINLLCNDDGCLTKLATSRSNLLSWDYGHLTTDGAEIVAHALQDSGNLRSALKND